ncbi:hypothetical protein HW555_003650 [Spodoptera exigua]|uniref:Uncharacterized protein n=1 Tax=Spodoptera exigua TaxID=7107 RepID=A0A835L920_SPOEX|nr:hypothetical protein HW555_003650 [Spodoptera exigua]
MITYIVTTRNKGKLPLCGNLPRDYNKWVILPTYGRDISQQAAAVVVSRPQCVAMQPVQVSVALCCVLSALLLRQATASPVVRHKLTLLSAQRT